MPSPPIEVIGRPSATGGLTVPGWGLVKNICAGRPGDGLLAVWQGPASSIDDARAQVIALGLRVKLLSPEAPVSGGVGTIRVNYEATGSPPGGLLGDDGSRALNTGPDGEPAETPESLEPDVVELVPCASSTALKAHPAFHDVRPACSSIDELLAHADISGAVAACEALPVAADVALALSYLGLRLAGVDHYDALGKTYTITRTLPSSATGEQIASLTADEGKVVSWSGVLGAELIPEPRYADAAGVPQAYSWRCVGARISRAGGPVKVTVTYQGAWAWSGLLYQGGTWYPEAPDR